MEPSTGPAPVGEPTSQATGEPTSQATSQATGEPAGRPVGRRRFLEFLLGFSILSTLAMVATPIVGFLVPPKTQGGAGGGRQLAGTTDNLPAGQGSVVAMGNKPVIVVNSDQGVHAFSAICTHLGCIVTYDSTLGHIVCPCHDGHFNAATGQVLSGPPPAPLPPVTVVVEGKDIYLVSA